MRNATATRTLFALALLGIAGCSHDPKQEALQRGVDLMDEIVHSDVLLQVVRDADPGRHPSTAARAALSGVVTANFRQPPDGIAILEGDKATQPWCVVLVGDDAKGEVRIEGYGDDTGKPAIVDAIAFPPK